MFNVEPMPLKVDKIENDMSYFRKRVYMGLGVDLSVTKSVSGAYLFTNISEDIRGICTPNRIDLLKPYVLQHCFII